jgi:zinc/manganese transport system substrate-binding protein
MSRSSRLSGRLIGALAVGGLMALSGCGAASNASGSGNRIAVVAAENQYGNVAQQIGGKFVRVTSVENNPDVDPHSYEVSPSVATEVAGADVVIQNGAGYDDFMNRLESASPDSTRAVIEVANLRGLPDSSQNPHLWYSPKTMPSVARALGHDLSLIEPAHTSYFMAKVATFIRSLKPWLTAIDQFKAAYPNLPVVTTEPVANYTLAAADSRIMTPLSLETDIMNGVDPAPQAVTLEENLLRDRKVKVFVYNQQVTSPLTEDLITVADKARVPIVGVYETMPTPGYSYQSWMLAEVQALKKAVASGISTRRL